MREEQEDRSVAKTQKTIMVPEDLHSVAMVFETTGGASFTRQVLAGLLKLLVDPLPAFRADPKQPWMGYAVALDKGEASVGDVVTRELERRVAHQQAELAYFDRRPDPKEGPERERLEKAIAFYREQLDYWKVLVSACEDATDAVCRIYKGVAPIVDTRRRGRPRGELIVWREVRRDGNVLCVQGDEVQPGDEVLR